MTTSNYSSAMAPRRQTAVKVNSEGPGRQHRPSCTLVSQPASKVPLAMQAGLAETAQVGGCSSGGTTLALFAVTTAFFVKAVA